MTDGTSVAVVIPASPSGAGWQGVGVGLGGSGSKLSIARTSNWRWAVLGSDKQSGVERMLILSRKPKEQVVIPHLCVTVTVLGVTGKRVRLGVTAPPDVAIRRRDVCTCASLEDTRRATAATGQNGTSPVRVLIADPDGYLVHSYRQHMERRGIEVICAASGLECIEKLQAFVPHVLVLEPSLPWGAGDDVLAIMRDEPGFPQVPVIILTDALDRSVLYRMAPFRVDDFQTKPLSGRRLTERILALAKHRPMETYHETYNR